MKPKQRLISTSFQYVILDQCKDESYREAAEKINLHYNRTGKQAMKFRTVADQVEVAGAEINEYISDLASQALANHDFNPETGLPLEEAALPDSFVHPKPEGEDELRKHHLQSVKKAVKKINSERSENNRIETKASHLAREAEVDYNNCVYLCIDDVGVKHQKEKRKGSYPKQSKTVQTTDINIEYQGRKYSIANVGMAEAFRRLNAFLLKNDLIANKHLIFMTDGATDIRKAIETYFPYLNAEKSIILDWFHLKKHCYETMSMAIRGNKDYKHAVQVEFNRLIWIGDIDKAIQYLEQIDKDHIKNQYKMTETIDYLKRKKPFVRCYALRAELGLPNSSNPVEKDNDLNVAARQKHNGMAWSYEGSGALSKITVTFRNGEMKEWLRNKTIPFTMPACVSAVTMIA